MLPEVPIVRSSSASTDENVLAFKKNLPVDCRFVVDFGQIVKEPVLGWDEPVGCLNVHPSLLPLYRGAAPVQRFLMQGGPVTGVTVFKLAPGMDSGPVLLSERIVVNGGDDAGVLLERAAVIGVSAFIKFAGESPMDKWTFKPQDDSLATYAPKIRTEDERILWDRPAAGILGLVRALSPKPGAWTTMRGRRLRVLRVSAAAEPPPELNETPGTLLGVFGGGVLVACSDDPLVLHEVQMEGKKIQPAAEWWNGLHAEREERFL
jgi:methionyl-tRNA formyltransferase